MTARRRVTFVLLRGTGQGGIARTVINLANHLVESYDVHLISVVRKRDEPVFPLDPRITVRHLIDLRPGSADRDPGLEEPSSLVPVDSYLSAAGDRRVVDALATVPPDSVVISSRPSLNLIAAEHAPPGVVTIGQEHLNLQVRSAEPATHDLAERMVRALDVLVTLTEGDADDYRRLAGSADTVITAIPNALSWPIEEPALLADKVIVAAGRLSEQKAFHRLIDAYAPVAAKRPDWQLHIYGTGEHRRQLRQQIRDHRIGAQVKLRGYTQDMPAALRQASGYAMTSIHEGFPMVLLEAMATGLPMIAYDCPSGPADLIDHGRNGWLIPDGDAAAYTAALFDLIDDADRRVRIGRAAWEDAHAYQMPHIIQRWRSLLDSVA